MGYDSLLVIVGIVVILTRIAMSVNDHEARLRKLEEE